MRRTTRLRCCAVLIIATSLLTSGCGSTVDETPASFGQDPAVVTTSGAGGQGVTVPEAAAAPGVGDPAGAGTAAAPLDTAAGMAQNHSRSNTAGAGKPSTQKSQKSQPAAVACDPSVNGVPITLGASLPLAGPVGFLGKQQLAALSTYANWFNSRGGYCGRTMKIVALDDGLEPTRQLANVRKLNEQNKVLAVSTMLTVGIGDYVTRANLPVLSLGGAMEQFGPEQPTVFPSMGSAYHFTGSIADTLLKNKTIAKGDRVALMYDTEIFNLAPVKDDLAEQWRKAGLQVVSVDPFNLSNLDCTSLLNKIRSLNIDYWDFQSFGWTLCVAAASRIGYKPNKGWGGWTASDPGIPELAGRAADGVWHMAGSRVDPDYAKLMKLYAPADMRTEEDLAAPPAVGTWAIIGEMEQILRGTNGNLTKDHLVEELHGVTQLMFMGKPVKVDFRADCKGGVLPSPGSGFRLAQWKYNAATDRFNSAFQGGEIGVNPYAGPCDAAKLAAGKY